MEKNNDKIWGLPIKLVKVCFLAGAILGLIVGFLIVING